MNYRREAETIISVRDRERALELAQCIGVLVSENASDDPSDRLTLERIRRGVSILVDDPIRRRDAKRMVVVDIETAIWDESRESSRNGVLRRYVTELVTLLEWKNGTASVVKTEAA